MDKNSLALDLETYEKALSEKTVLRLCRKVFGGEEVIDLRLWKLAKKGYLYPSRNGICMRSSFWKDALKLFSDNSLPISNVSETIS